MTPEETAQALELCRLYSRPRWRDTDVGVLARAVLALTEQFAEANATINTRLHLSDLTDQRQYDDEQGRQVLPQAIRFPGEVLKEWELSLDDITSRETELLDAAMVVHICELRRLMGTGRIEQQPEPDAWEGDVMSPATQRFLTGPQPEPVSQIDLRDDPDWDNAVDWLVNKTAEDNELAATFRELAEGRITRDEADNR